MLIAFLGYILDSLSLFTRVLGFNLRLISHRSRVETLLTCLQILLPRMLLYVLSVVEIWPRLVKSGIGIPFPY